MAIQVSKTPQGLTVATDPMPSVESVSIGVWVNVGTRHEPKEINGVAHLLEHMAFKGTARRDAFAIAKEIEAVGGHINAYTTREHTAYYAKVLAEHVPLALDILADILQHSTFDEQELQRERTVVLQEIGQAYDTPDDIIFDHFQETAYPEQPLGRPVLGRSEIVGQLEAETLRGYMQRNYVPGNMIVAAAGKVEHNGLVDSVTQLMGDLKANGHAGVEPALYRGGDYREPRDLEQVHLLLGFESLGYRDPDYYALNLLSTLFGGGMSSRLFQEVREKRGLVYSIYSFSSAYADSGLFGIYAGTGAQEIRELVPVICGELTKLARSVDEDELQSAKAQARASLLMSKESSSSRCEQLAQHILNYGRPLSHAELLQHVDAVTTEGISGLATRFLAQAPTIATIGPIVQMESFESVCARFS